ncbi:Peptidyl-prolyl cis-trans isomerase CWC27 like protein [Eufriesea mexicana]|uniref:Spliceosome-associated protein CWC27 homolog n=1 Tax=Eufriesea mexicana TaxID=516756 RepID=A0A310SDN3_9HYME|nr:Peptidyl-prolyl cis-trans isomerase CWC27 like protein [Eufriesea mexicana]
MMSASHSSECQMRESIATKFVFLELLTNDMNFLNTPCCNNPIVLKLSVMFKIIVILKTTVGDIELEEWAKETPKNDFRTRLRFSRRDLIAMANTGKDGNDSQFFFTLSSTPDLQNKHTIFGPLYPPRLIRTIILDNLFSDIIPRITVQEIEEVKDNSKTKAATVKDFNLLSFGEEAEEDEEESVILNKKFNGKGISAHDHLTDAKLSSQPAIESLGRANKKRKGDIVAIGKNYRPLYPPRLIRTIILDNLFSDIIPRITVQEIEEVKDNSKTKAATVKDFNLLSFGEEAEEDEEESVILNKKFSGKGKSAHDHLSDPKLSTQ